MNKEKIDNGIKFKIKGNTLEIEGLLKSNIYFDFYETNKDFFKHSNIKKINVYGIEIIDFDLFSKGCFMHFNHLESVNFCDNNIRILGTSALEECTNLKKVKISDSVTEIGTSAFGKCEKLKNVVLPKKLEKIGSYAFYKCEELENIEIPNNVKEIGFCAFEYCVNLKSITIPESVTKIEKLAFIMCDNLESISISNNFYKIYDIEYLEECCKKLSYIKPLYGKFNAELVKNLCDGSERTTKILFKELFTNPYYFDKDAVIILLNELNKHLDFHINEVETIIKENINCLNDFAILYMLISMLSNNNQMNNSIILINKKIIELVSLEYTKQNNKMLIKKY